MQHEHLRVNWFFPPKSGGLTHGFFLPAAYAYLMPDTILTVFLRSLYIMTSQQVKY